VGPRSSSCRSSGSNDSEPVPDLEVRRLTPQATITVRLESAPDGISAVFDSDLRRVGARMEGVGAVMAGPPFARYDHIGPDRMDVEIGAPIVAAPAARVRAAGQADGVIGASSPPAGEAAVVVHTGSFDTLPDTYDRLKATIETAGRIPGVGPWEVYLTDPERVPDPADWLTEVVWPLE